MAVGKYANDQEFKNWQDEYGMPAGSATANVLGGAASGATAGAAFGPEAALAGGIVGAGVGVAQSVAARNAAYEAWKRDQELEKELNQVNNLADYLDATAVRTSIASQNAETNAKMGAARSGVQGIAGEALAQEAVSGIQQGRAVELASALPAAKAADIAQRNEIMQEQYGRQQLFTQASKAPDYLGAFGSAAGAAAELGQIKTGGFEQFGTGSQDTATRMAGAEANVKGFFGGTDQYGDPLGGPVGEGFGTSGPAQPNDAYSTDRTASNEAVGGQDLYQRETGYQQAVPGETGMQAEAQKPGFAQTGQIDFTDLSGVDLTSDSGKEQLALQQLSAQADRDQATRDAQLAVLRNIVTPSEMQHIVQTNPTALEDPLALQMAISSYQESAYQAVPYSPYGSQAVGPTPFIDINAMDPMARAALARQMTGGY